MTLIPDFTESQSVAMIKVHHCVGDGMALIIMIGLLQDEYLKSQWIQTTSVNTLCKKITISLLKPFTAIYAFFYFLFWVTDKNFIKSKVNLAGVKHNTICKPFSVEQLKKIGKKYGGTVNDAVLGILSMSLKQYLR